MPGRRSKGFDVGRSLARLADLSVNYTIPEGVEPGPATGWHRDTQRTVVGQEPVGEPGEGGAWALACQVVRDYEFAEPRILHAIYRGAAPVVGRDMLLEGRFFGLRFYMGVRVTEVIDERRDGLEGPTRVWGWAYETLDGHLEKGHLSYEVVKHLDTGVVEFVIDGYSQRAPIPNPVIRWGFRVFGRNTQVRFYRGCAERIQRLVKEALDGHPLPIPQAFTDDDSLLLAPSDATTSPVAALAPRSHDPGTE
ncbi:MAG: DUF1990 family protein [Nocardioidaceae bacterium]